MMDSQTDAISSVAVLIEAVGRDSQIALKRLYELESRRLHGIALRIVRRPEIAADVLQEAFVQIWQNAAAFSVGQKNLHIVAFVGVPPPPTPWRWPHSSCMAVWSVRCSPI